MGKSGIQGIAELQRQFEALNKKLQAAEIEEFCRIAAKELAARLLAQVIKRTPVGVYPKESGKMGGTLRRGWTSKTEEEAASAKGKGATPVEYARALPITKSGNKYEIEIINPVSYASYVEYGHRQTPGRYVPAIGKRLKQEWVKGEFMLTLSEKEVQRQSSRVIEAKLRKFMEDVFNGR